MYINVKFFDVVSSVLQVQPGGVITRVGFVMHSGGSVLLKPLLLDEPATTLDDDTSTSPDPIPVMPDQTLALPDSSAAFQDMLARFDALCGALTAGVGNQHEAHGGAGHESRTSPRPLLALTISVRSDRALVAAVCTYYRTLSTRGAHGS